MVEIPNNGERYIPLAPSEIVQRLDESYIAIATDLISSRSDAAVPANRSFAENPNDPAEHAPHWHQYGIYTHSKKFVEALQTDVPALVGEWGLAVPVATALAVEVDGIPKGQLLPIAALVHDFGKYTARKLEYDESGVATAAGFRGHEKDSGEVVRNQLSPMLRSWGLGENAIEYIAVCAELHFELGKVRNAAYDADGYTMSFATKSSACMSAIKDILNEYPDYALEIGLEFLADSLSKTEVAPDGKTNEQIEQELEDKNLHPNLIGQVIQLPVNIKVGERYLRTWAGPAAA